MKGTLEIFHAVWMAAVLVILHSGYATAGALPLERRQGGVTVETDAWCDRMEVPGLTQKDCNTAFVNLGFQGAHAVVKSNTNMVTSVFGSCRVVLQCPSDVSVTGGRLLTNNRRDGGFEKLQAMCTSQLKTGQISIEGGCLVRTASSKDNL